jgi:alpha-glucoside transport system substrate-binding protein
VLASLALVGSVAGCSGGDDGGDDATTAASEATMSAECAAYQDYAGHSGTTVDVYGSILSPESDSMETAWKEFEECTGIDIVYTGDNSFESQLPIRAQGGTPPDIAVIPQPGLIQRMATLATGTKAVPAPDEVKANIEANYSSSWVDYATVDGEFYGGPNSANMKTMVWYSPTAFAAAGYAIPTTWEEMMTLSDTIAATGKKPWCGGIGSGTATGWPATDWVEELVLSAKGGDVYDKWVAGDIKFNSPEINDVMNILDGWMRNPNYVNGGFGDVATIATTTFQDAGLPILSGECFMLQQAGFYGAQWPEGTKVDPDGGDVAAFYLPPYDASTGKPVIGGGEFFVAFNDRPEVQAVQIYFSTPEWPEARIPVATGWVSANKAVDQSLYTDPIDKLSAQYLTDPEALFRFDGSDLMPAAVGSGAEWTALTNWFNGTSTEETLAAIDAAWPTD